VLGELALKWLEMTQTGLPMTSLSAFMGPLQLTTAEKAILWRQYVPWAVRCGQQSKFLLNVDYEAKLSSNADLGELREELGLSLAPQVDFSKE
jgi:ubiquinone biosynthesis protein COQ4